RALRGVPQEPGRSLLLLRQMPGGSTGDHGPGHRAVMDAPACGAKPSIQRRYRVASASEQRGRERETSEDLIVPVNSELTSCSRNTNHHAALPAFAIFTFTVCSTWFVMTRNRSACCS